LIAVEEVAMLRKRKEPKRKSVAEILLRDIQGSPAEKLALFRKVKATGRICKRGPGRVESGRKTCCGRSSRSRR
jgi:hypothetical protein